MHKISHLNYNDIMQFKILRLHLKCVVGYFPSTHTFCVVTIDTNSIIIKASIIDIFFISLVSHQPTLSCLSVLNVTWRPSRYNTAFCKTVFNDSSFLLNFITEAAINRTFALMVMHARKPQRISDGYDKVLNASALQSVDGGRRFEFCCNLGECNKYFVLFSGTLRSISPIRIR